VSGFLGAGKTTFIRSLIQHTHKELVVLENEYGQTGLDSRDISAAGKVNVWEMLEGCVCCTMKDSFAASVITISSTLNPEFLVIEPTGVAKLGNILQNIAQVAYEKISILKPVVIIVPRSFYVNLHQYGEIYKDQIRNAGTVIFSKIENEDCDFLREIRRKLLEINSNIEIVDCNYENQETCWWNGLLGVTTIVQKKGDLEEITSQEHVQEHHHYGKNDLQSFTIKDVFLNNPAQLVVLLEDILHGDMGEICRAKGTLMAGKIPIRFDLADGLYALKGEENDNWKTELVFIGKEINKSKILSRFNLKGNF